MSHRAFPRLVVNGVQAKAEGRTSPSAPEPGEGNKRAEILS